MNKWKDTGRVRVEIVKKNVRGEDIILQESALFVVEKELPKNKYLVSDSNPNSITRRQYSLTKDDLVIEDYGVTRDINVPVLLADGWDAQDLLRTREIGDNK